ncbi:MAG: deoxyribodipyrimidine photo-lyase [Phycisphaerae bacterium]|nr:deoxyribodipyrimidine photo-lyase [Phycisphaerae bacterium]
MTIYSERLEDLNGQPEQAGQIVLYWMQAAQRAQCNHALEYAVERANALGLPAVVLFCVTDAFPEANARHYQFMLQGIRETQQTLADRGLRLMVHHGHPEQTVPRAARKAALVVTDTGHLRIQRQWRAAVASELACRMVQVETNLVVPVEAVSDKENFSAGTLRPRMHRVWDRFLVPLNTVKPKHTSLDVRVPIKAFDLSRLDRAMAGLDIDRTVPPVTGFVGGPSQAQARLEDFVEHKLDRFTDLRNDPSQDFCSGLSPYLHFGQMSPLTMALAVLATDSPGKEALVEELIVRRELAFNYVHYNPRYDQYEGLAPWALRTLNFHTPDRREYLYTRTQFEQADTHDPFWNAAQLEMVVTGKMHGYMRMYWGKKILEWSKTPKEAFDTALYLNNKYELDGRDPNGFAGVAWCFGQHDRAWGERPVYGKVRYMNANGLKRKFNIQAYVAQVRCLER